MFHCVWTKSNWICARNSLAVNFYCHFAVKDLIGAKLIKNANKGFYNVGFSISKSGPQKMIQLQLSLDLTNWSCKSEKFQENPNYWSKKVNQITTEVVIDGHDHLMELSWEGLPTGLYWAKFLRFHDLVWKLVTKRLIFSYSIRIKCKETVLMTIRSFKWGR